MSDLYHIYIQRKKGSSQEDVEKIMNLAVDWYRYRDGAYVILTTSDQNKWKERFGPLVKPDGFLFISKLDVKNYQGWMPQNFWTWFEDKVKKIT